MKSMNKFFQEHRGHEKQIPGSEYPETVKCTSMGLRPKFGEARCPLCAIEEKVFMTDRICDKHRYGEHITIKCEKCGEVGNTKNISQIGARSLFIMCVCDDWKPIHVCNQTETKCEFCDGKGEFYEEECFFCYKCLEEYYTSRKEKVNV
jgi:hypothetical protein